MMLLATPPTPTPRAPDATDRSARSLLARSRVVLGSRASAQERLTYLTSVFLRERHRRNLSLDVLRRCHTLLFAEVDFPAGGSGPGGPNTVLDDDFPW